METYFAEELRKLNLYEQRGNAHIYHGRYSELTQADLAAELSEGTGADFDAGNLSRILNGTSKRLFDERELRILCEILGAPEEIYVKLVYATFKELCRRKGFEIDSFITLPNLKLVMNSLKRIRQLKTEGNYSLALDLLGDLYEWKDDINKIGLFDIPLLLRLSNQLDIEQMEILLQMKAAEYSESMPKWGNYGVRQRTTRYKEWSRKPNRHLPRFNLEPGEFVNKMQEIGENLPDKIGSLRELRYLLLSPMQRLLYDIKEFWWGFRNLSSILTRELFNRYWRREKGLVSPDGSYALLARNPEIPIVLFRICYYELKLSGEENPMARLINEVQCQL